MSPQKSKPSGSNAVFMSPSKPAQPSTEHSLALISPYPDKLYSMRPHSGEWARAGRRSMDGFKAQSLSAKSISVRTTLASSSGAHGLFALRAAG